jgi:hypothetical protein
LHVGTLFHRVEHDHRGRPAANLDQ